MYRKCVETHLSLMADNILLSFEGFCAAVANKKPLITVNVLFMDLQIAAVSKGLLAGLTAIDHICFYSMVRTGQESSNGLQQDQKTKGLVLGFMTRWQCNALSDTA